jgi:peptide-methionine (S)-S-oxide reductase
MRRLILVAAGATLLVVAAQMVVVFRSDANAATVLPPPVLDEASRRTTTELAVLADGCFWGVLQHVAGVTGAVSGYAGGSAATPHDDEVETGATGHAQFVRIAFDPRRISYGRILQICFSVAIDPTELDTRGPDRGTQYRTTIFPTTQEQANVAKAYIAQLDRARVFCQPRWTPAGMGINHI